MAENEIDVKYPITDVELPSRAVIYDKDIVPEIIKIRPMTTKEEKILYGSNSNNALDMVIKSCVVEPRALNLAHLIIPDKYALLINLRIISIGDAYKVLYRCPKCGEENEYEINLSELPINYLEEDFEEPLPIELKSIGSTVEVRLLRGKDLDDVDDMVKRVKRKSKTFTPGDMGYTMRMAKYIQKIDGNAVSFDNALKFVETWTTKTSLEFRNALDDIEVGYDITLYKNCGSCGEDLEFDMPFTGEFFRPSR